MYHKKKKKVKKNKVTTMSYFIKRLKDNGFEVWKIFNKYSEDDNRKWTVLINPGVESVYITCCVNHSEINDVVFSFNDGGRQVSRNNLKIATSSMEVIIEHLIQRDVTQPHKSASFTNQLEIA